MCFLTFVCRLCPIIDCFPFLLFINLSLRIVAVLPSTNTFGEINFGCGAEIITLIIKRVHTSYSAAYLQASCVRIRCNTSKTFSRLHIYRPPICMRFHGVPLLCVTQNWSVISRSSPNRSQLFPQLL